MNRRRRQWGVSGLLSLGTHLALVLAVFLGVGPHYEKREGPSVRDLSELAINFDLVSPVEAAPPPIRPASTTEPRAMPRRGHAVHQPRPAQEQAPIAAPPGPNPLEPPAFEEAHAEEAPADTGSGSGPTAPGASARVALSAAAPGLQSSEPLSISSGEAGYLRTYESYPSLPRSLWVVGRVYSVLTQICVSARGEVSDVAIKRGAAPELDRAVTAALRSWRYRPRMVEGAPRPFCHLMKLDFTLR
jgi:outer membrane biosynthesis protein TonB